MVSRQWAETSALLSLSPSDALCMKGENNNKRKKERKKKGDSIQFFIAFFYFLYFSPPKTGGVAFFYAPCFSTLEKLGRLTHSTAIEGQGRA